MRENVLWFIREFQKRVPGSHVGGSIGLWLHGIDLKRDLQYSDVDMTSPVNLTIEKVVRAEKTLIRSSTQDFEHAFNYHFSDGEYVQTEVRIDPNQRYEIIKKDGHEYRVTALDLILKWKEEYAKKGVMKHEYDLNAIKTGIRVPDIEETLPF